MIDADVLDKLSLNTKYAVEILERLEGFGYIATMADEIVLKLLCEKFENHIKNFCNVSGVPEGLKSVYVDMVCGEFLNEKFKLNQLGDGFNIDTAISKVTMGDVSVTYDGKASTDVKIQTLIDALSSKVGDLICYRKMKW